MDTVTQERLEFLKAMIIEGYPNLWEVNDQGNKVEVILKQSGRKIELSSYDENSAPSDDKPLSLTKVELQFFIAKSKEIGLKVEADEDWVNSLFK